MSPVPLTATATDQHVLVATGYSKAVLRAVAGQLYADFEDVDYFPSFELITSSLARGAFFEENLRSVAPAGVALVMDAFFRAYGITEAEPARPTPTPSASAVIGEDVQCEEVLLEAFSS